MDSQNAQISGWNNTCDSGSMSDKTIGTHIYPLRSSRTTIGRTKLQESPFFVLYGFNPRADWMDKPSPIPQVVLRLDQFKMARQRTQELMIKAQQSWVKHKDTPKYQEGDLVWLEGCHLHTNQPTAKLAPKRHGPFPIIQVMSPINYRLKLPTQWSIHDVFHIDLLTPYRETDLHGSNYSRPAPDLINNNEEYEIERILDSRQFGRG